MLTTILFALMNLSFPHILSDFSAQADFQAWRIVNDGVMGGMSQGMFVKTDDGHAIFRGEVSLENNGGFTSVRKRMDVLDINGAKKVKIKLKGDGKNYQFRVKEELSDRHQYKYEFETSGEWETVSIPLKKMIPTWRGMRPNLPNFQAEQLSEIGFLIANKKNEAFALEIEKIWIE